MILHVDQHVKSIKSHMEWVAFLTGLILMATMDPFTTGPSFCIVEQLGFNYCPGEGLGHSIAFLFRGDFEASLQANLLGPLAVIILSLRIMGIWKALLTRRNNNQLIESE